VSLDHLEQFDEVRGWSFGGLFDHLDEHFSSHAFSFAD